MREPGSDDIATKEPATTAAKKVPAEEVTLALGEKTLPAAAVAASLTNNWAGVSQRDRLRFVGALCDSLNIPMPLCPFRFIKMRDREVLYAPNEAAALIGNHNRVSVTELRREYEKETQILTIWMRASQPDGRSVDNCAAAFLGGKTGEDRCNAIMKTHTKALRRSVLAAVGLAIATDDDLAAMRNIQSAAGVQSLADAEPAPPPDLSADDREKGEGQLELFRRLCGKGGKFEGDMMAANKWISERTGKIGSRLEAWESEQLLADLDAEEGPDPNQVEMPL